MGVAPTYLSSSVIELLAQVGTTTTELNKTSQRLATGRKINSPQDDVSIYFQANNLQSRAKDIQALNGGLLMARKAMSTAQSGLDSMGKQLETLSKTLETAMSDSADDPGARALSTVSYAGRSASLVGPDAARFNDGDVFSIDVGPSGGAKMFFRASTTGGASGTGSAGSPFRVKSVGDLLDRINTAVWNDGTTTHQVAASLDGGRIAIDSSAQMKIALETNAGGTPFNDVNAMFSGAASSSLVPNTSSQATFAVTTASNTAIVARESAYTQYRQVIDQINATARDAGVNGQGNVLLGDGLSGAVLNIQLGEDVNNTMQVQFSSASDSNGLGLATTYASRFGSQTDIQDAFNAVKSAMETVKARQKSLAGSEALISNRQDFNKAMADTLTGTANELTAADTDEESMRFATLQTSRQLSFKMISSNLQSTQMLLNFL